MNYQNSKIYAIKSRSNPDLIYVGATTKTLSERLEAHRDQYQAWKYGQKASYYTSFKLIELDDHYIELIENYPCLNKKELNCREGIAIRSMPTVNRIRLLGRTHSESMSVWYKKNRLKQLAKMKKYYHENKTRIKRRMFLRKIKKEFEIDKLEFEKSKSAFGLLCSKIDTFLI